MLRFQFRFERILKYHQQRQREAELRLQQANLTLEAARSERAAVEEQLLQAAATMDVEVGRPTHADVRISGFHRLLMIDEVLETALAEVRNCEQKLQQINNEYAQITTEAEALLYLQKQQWEQHQKWAARKVQEQMDEVAMRMWSGADSDVPMNQERRIS